VGRPKMRAQRIACSLKARLSWVDYSVSYLPRYSQISGGVGVARDIGTGERESAELATQMICETVARHEVIASKLTLYADRCASMRSKPVAVSV
jgi:hypothetical protein